MNKQDVIDIYILTLEKTIREIEVSLKTIRIDIDDSPSPTQSHSDTTRSRLAGVESEISRRLSSLRETRIMADSIFSRKLDYPTVGALIEIMDKNAGKKEYYFIIPGGGGERLNVNGLEVISVSMGAPIIEVISETQVGRTVEFRGRTLTLLDIS